MAFCLQHVILFIEFYFVRSNFNQIYWQRIGRQSHRLLNHFRRPQYHRNDCSAQASQTMMASKACLATLDTCTEPHAYVTLPSNSKNIVEWAHLKWAVDMIDDSMMMEKHHFGDLWVELCWTVKKIRSVVNHRRDDSKSTELCGRWRYWSM